MCKSNCLKVNYFNMVCAVYNHTYKVINCVPESIITKKQLNLCKHGDCDKKEVYIDSCGIGSLNIFIS